MARDQEFRSRDKKTHKMTKDGLVEVNQTTGEESRISQRGQDFQMSRKQEPGRDSALASRLGGDDTGSGSGRQRQHPQPPSEPIADSRVESASRDTLQQDIPMGQDVPQDHSASYSAPDTPAFDTHNPRPVEASPGGRFSGSREERRSSRQKQPQHHRVNDHKTSNERQADADSADSSPYTDKALPDSSGSDADIPVASPTGDRPIRLQFNTSPLDGKARHQKRRGTQYTKKFSDPPPDSESPHPTDHEGGETQSEAPKEQQSGPDSKPASDSSPKSGKASRLQFSSEELPPDALPKRLSKLESKAQRTAQRLTGAKKKLPTHRRIRRKKTVDAETGKAKRKFTFEKEVKTQRQHVAGPLPTRPVKAAGNAAVNQIHRKISQVEHENVAVEAAHKGELMAEQGIRRAYRMHKTAPYRRVTKLERQVKRRTIKFQYEKALHDNPKLKSNMLSRFMQKQKIKRQYAKAAREAKRGVKNAKKAGELTAKIAQAIGNFISRHPMAVGIVLLCLLLVFVIMTMFGSCSNMGMGILSSVVSTSYVAEDQDIDNAELAYGEWETELLLEIQNAEATHPGFDEYKYNVADISHDPYELMAYLTAKYQDFTFAQIQAELRSIFNEQYKLEFVEEVEVRYRTETRTDEDGNEYEVEVPYNWYILNINLTAKSFSEVIRPRMDSDQRELFDILMDTKGNRQYALNPFAFNWIPYISSNYGYRVHPISGVKDYHKGIDIAAPAGTEILATHDGTVTFAGTAGDYGLVVVIEDDKGLVTKYAHCSELLVSTGQTVEKGDPIARVGSTGNSTGPHLHFEVIYQGQYLNPLFFSETGDDGTGRIPPGQPGGVEYPEYPGTPLGDGSYAALIAEAELHLGKKYVFGASGPNSFDCSGYVSWVLDKSGVKPMSRTNAQGLYNMCTPVSPENAQPGDLVFFQGTYSSSNPVSHVGIYVGGGRMIHCGNPISYTSINSSYWQSHFYSFGRIN